MNKLSAWKYDVTQSGNVIIVSPAGDDYALVRGGSLQTRKDRAALMVSKLNK